MWENPNLPIVDVWALKFSAQKDKIEGIWSTPPLTHILKVRLKNSVWTFCAALSKHVLLRLIFLIGFYWAILTETLYMVFESGVSRVLELHRILKSRQRGRVLLKDDSFISLLSFIFFNFILIGKRHRPFHTDPSIGTLPNWNVSMLEAKVKTVTVTFWILNTRTWTTKRVVWLAPQKSWLVSEKCVQSLKVFH